MAYMACNSAQDFHYSLDMYSIYSDTTTHTKYLQLQHCVVSFQSCSYNYSQRKILVDLKLKLSGLTWQYSEN